MTTGDAASFAAAAHHGQVRKYTGEPYFRHCIEVAQIVRTVKHTKEMVMAAYLHDTVEDCEVTIEQIRENFGEKVAQLVDELTDKATLEMGNRRFRKDFEAKRLGSVSNEAKTVKLADLISNTKSITKYDLDFARVYMHEKERLLPMLVGGDKTLFAQAEKLIAEWNERKKSL